MPDFSWHCGTGTLMVREILTQVIGIEISYSLAIALMQKEESWAISLPNKKEFFLSTQTSYLLLLSEKYQNLKHCC